MSAGDGDMQIREQGWECPKCGMIWAPKIGSCSACSNRQTLPAREIPTYKPSSFTPQWTIDPDPEWRPYARNHTDYIGYADDRPGAEL